MPRIRERIKGVVKALRKPVPKYIVRSGKRYEHHGGAAFSKSFRDFIREDLAERGYESLFTFTKPRGYQIYKRKKR